MSRSRTAPVILLALALTAIAAPIKARPLISVGEQAPAFQKPGLDGAVISLSDWTAASMTVVVFFSINQKNSMQIFRDIESVLRAFDRPPARLMGVSLDINPGRVMDAFIAAGQAVPTIIDPELKIAAEFGISAPPAVLLIDREMTVRLVFTNWSQANAQALQLMIEETSGAPLRGREPPPDELVDKMLVGSESVWSAMDGGSRRMIYLTSAGELFLFEAHTRRRALLSRAAAQPSLSRDGRFLVFVGLGDQAVYLINLDAVVFPEDTADSAPTTPTLRVAERGVAPDVSIHGELVVYGVEGSGIYMKDMNTDKRRRILNDGTRARFTADGLFLLVTDENGALWVTQNHLRQPGSIF